MLSNKKTKTKAASKREQAKRKAKIECDISRVRYCVNKLNEYMNTTNASKINVNDLFGVFLAEFKYEIHTFDYYKTEMKEGFYIRFYEGEEAQLVFLEDKTGNQKLKFDDFKTYEIWRFGIW